MLYREPQTPCVSGEGNVRLVQARDSESFSIGGGWAAAVGGEDRE
jgi:hypothetical protein